MTHTRYMRLLTQVATREEADNEDKYTVAEDVGPLQDRLWTM